MKKIVMLLLLVSSVAFSQAQKDSLFAKDVTGIYNTLKVMNHLDEAVMDYYRMPAEEKNASMENFQEYLKKNIIATNPVSDVDLLQYLEIYLQKDIPQDWESFIKKVNNMNAKMLLAITDRYGYPSKERLDKFTGISTGINTMNFAMRANDYQYAIGKMLKRENKKGNVSDSYLELYAIIGGKTFATQEDIKKLEKLKLKQEKRKAKKTAS